MADRFKSGAHEHLEFVTHKEMADAIAEARLGSPVVPEPVVPEPVIPVEQAGWNFNVQRVENVDYANILALREFGHGRMQYFRQTIHLVLSGQTVLNIFRAGIDGKFSLIGKFDIYFNDVLMLTTEELNTSDEAWGFNFPFDSTLLSDGRYWVRIVPHDANANDNPTPIPFPVYILNTAEPIDNLRIPVWKGTYDIIRGGRPLWWGACEIPGDLPPRATPLSRPMPELPKALRVIDGRVIRESEIPEIILTADAASQTVLVPRRIGDTHRFQMDANGILSSTSIHGYYLDWTNDWPKMPLLDGPRGVGTVACMTSLEIDSTGGVFGTDGFRIVRVWPDGRVQTRCGWRHKGAVSNDMELVGDWSAVEGPHGFLELWGIDWDTRTKKTDDSLEWVPISDTDRSARPPHPGPVVLFCADTRNNRICKVEFQPGGADTVMGVHDIEPKVTEFITGLSNPWKVRYYDGRLFITERTANRITVYSADEPETYLLTLIEGPPEQSFRLDSRQQVRLSIPLPKARLYNCIAPEGMVIFDGKIYWGSIGTLEIKQMDLVTGEISVVWDMKGVVNANDRFVNFEIAKDSTVTKRGNLAIATWGRCVFLNPETGVYSSPPSHHYREPNVDGSGITQYWITSYPSAIGLGNGRFAIAMPFEGLNVIHSRIPLDTSPDWARYRSGEEKYEWAGYKLTHGQYGNSNHNLPLPWGVHPDIDYYLESNGHKTF